MESFDRFDNLMLFTNILLSQIPINYILSQLLITVAVSMYQHGTAEVLSIYEKTDMPDSVIE